MKGTFLRRRLILCALAALTLAWPASATADLGVEAALPSGAPFDLPFLSMPKASVPAAGCKRKATCAKTLTRTLAAVVLNEQQSQRDTAIIAANPCIPDERLDIKGRVTEVLRIVQDTGGGMHIEDQYKAVGSGTGSMPSATESSTLVAVSSYQYSEDSLSSQNIGLLPMEMNFVHYTRAVRQGESIRSDDAFIREQTHVTINANGTITADFSKGPTLECR